MSWIQAFQCDIVKVFESSIYNSYLIMQSDLISINL